MAIFARPADTWSCPTLMGRVLPGLIKNRFGSGFLQKPDPNPDLTRPEPRLDSTRLKLKLPKKP